MQKVDELLAASKIEDLLKKEEENEKSCKLCWILVGIFAVLAVAGIAYALYKYFTPKYYDEFDDDFDYDEFDAWFNNDRRKALIAEIGVNPYGSFSIGCSYMGDELRLTITPSNYTTPQPDLVGYISEITPKGKLVAYANYAGTLVDISKPYDTVMVAYYSDDDKLEDVSLIEMDLDEHGRAELTADCPDEFAYCRIFVVGSDENPEPLCDLLELSVTK